MSKVKTVPMIRDGKTADVHPDEVENWKGHGWREVGDVPKAAGEKPSADSTAKEIRAFLQESGVEIPAGARKADLVALLDDLDE